jgi:hypothetical protein
MDPDAPALVSDRVFILSWRGVDVARLQSRGSGEMFWETFLVEALTLPPHEKLLDPEAWANFEFALRHERTGTSLKNLFSAGGRPPRLEEAGTHIVSLRGTYMFSAPSPTTQSHLFGSTFRALVNRLWPPRRS